MQEKFGKPRLFKAQRDFPTYYLTPHIYRNFAEAKSNVYLTEKLYIPPPPPLQRGLGEESPKAWNI